jgi:hypothetical protein
MEKISFATNKPEEVRLAFLEGKPVEGRFGDQYLFSTTDNRCFYVSTTVGQIIEKQLMNLKVTTGEPIEIGKFEMDLGRGRKGIQWLVKRVGYAPGEQPDGTFVVPGAGVSAPAPVATPVKEPFGSSNGNGSKPPAIATGWAQFLLEQTTTMCDVLAAAVRYSQEMHGDAVKVDDIRSILLSAYIQMSKGGQRAA